MSNRLDASSREESGGWEWMQATWIKVQLGWISIRFLQVIRTLRGSDYVNTALNSLMVVLNAAQLCVDVENKRNCWFYITTNDCIDNPLVNRDSGVHKAPVNCNGSCLHGCSRFSIPHVAHKSEPSRRRLNTFPPVACTQRQNFLKSVSGLRS